MDKITITYYGHACFRISYQGSSVILDPYQHGSVPGLELPSGLQADAVYCSHAHADHNARNLVTLTGRKEPFSVSTMQVPHDEEGETEARHVPGDDDRLRRSYPGPFGGYRKTSDAEGI